MIKAWKRKGYPNITINNKAHLCFIVHSDKAKMCD